MNKKKLKKKRKKLKRLNNRITKLIEAAEELKFQIAIDLARDPSRLCTNCADFITPIDAKPCTSA